MLKVKVTDLCPRHNVNLSLWCKRKQTFRLSPKPHLNCCLPLLATGQSLRSIWQRAGRVLGAEGGDALVFLGRGSDQSVYGSACWPTGGDPASVDSGAATGRPTSGVEFSADKCVLADNIISLQCKKKSQLPVFYPSFFLLSIPFSYFCFLWTRAHICNITVSVVMYSSLKAFFDKRKW